jgi:lysophospholipase L1-like esterase
VVLNASAEDNGDQTHALKDYLSPFNSDEEINRLNNMQPQLIMINHGANDFEAPKPPTPEEFIRGYMEMVKQVRAGNPQAVIICLEPVPRESGSIARPLIKRAVKQLKREGMANLHFIALNKKGQLLLDEDFADGEHPLISGHTKIAEQLKEKVARLMQWY